MMRSLACLAAIIPLTLSIELPKQTAVPAQDAGSSVTSTVNDFAASGGSTRSGRSGRPSRPGSGTPGGGTGGGRSAGGRTTGGH
jgi:hypothetical protein